jgi:glycolate oxidase iron-sulfur subunit
MTTCPSGVHYQHLIDHARDHIERTYRRPLRERWLRALLAAVLPFPRRLRWALALAAWVPGWMRRAAVLPASLRAMLALSAVPIAASAIPAGPAARAPARRGRIALLTGCAQGVLTPETHAASARLLAKAGWEVVPVSGCCGALTHHLGQREPTVAFAARLLVQLRRVQDEGALAAVVVNASGCGTHLKDYGHLFRQHPQLAQDAAFFSSITCDITELLAKAALPLQPLTGAPLIAYHSACSMQHGQGLDALPRQLLRAAGFELRDVPEGHLCCGSAGTYNILQPELAAALRDRKLANIARSGAAAVATGNVGCIVQLRSGTALPVVHTVELLDWACGGPRPAALSQSQAAR